MRSRWWRTPHATWIEDVAEYVADWIGDAAEDVGDREGHRRSRGTLENVGSANEFNFSLEWWASMSCRKDRCRKKRVQECIVEETDFPVACVEEEIIEVAKHGTQERVLSYAVEQSVNVPDPLIQEENC